MFFSAFSLTYDYDWLWLWLLFYGMCNICSDLRNNRISVIEDGAFEGMHQLEEL